MTKTTLPRDDEEVSAIVLLHGDFSDGQESWGRVCDLVGRRYRTVVVDRPGVGAQLGPEDRFSIASEARYVADALDQMGFSSFHLVGHSYGALIALELTATQPHRVRSLHLLEPPLLDLLPDESLVRDLDRGVRSIVEKHATAGDEATTVAFFSLMGAERGIERIRGTADWDRLCAHASRFTRNEPAGDFPSSMLDRLPESVPVTLYTGGRSHPALRLIVAELANTLDRAHVVEVAGAGHAVQLSGTTFVDELLADVQEADRRWRERELHPTGESRRE